MNDNLDSVWSGFYSSRVKPLAGRFPGRYRALVVETNDPLRMHRVRFRIPEMHDADLKPEECPWAVPDHDMGNRRSGRWTHPCIGDWVWIDFEKGHPYGPVWTGFATPTRRKFYTYPSVFGPTPIPVDEQSNLAAAPNDFVDSYMPKDQRPMNHGWSDRYGNLDIHNSVGYYPSQHKLNPPPADLDALTASNFKQSTSQPVANDPDSKFMARMSKYGHLLLQSDIGYTWTNEFTGDFDSDESFEIDRWKYIQRVLHEDAPKGRDQRRMMMLTRYGHKMEMRDVGWFHNRSGEYGAQVEVAPNQRDERWVKLRTKAGHLIESIDIGADELNDEFVKRLIIDEVAAPTPLDEEDKFGDDGRQIRLVTRSGQKIVIDDRQSHRTKAQDPGLPNTEIGTGILIKGRATPGASCDYASQSGDPKGYYFEISERPGRNHSTWGSPLGQAIEVSDEREAIMLCSRIPGLPMPCAFLGDNEFLEESTFSLSAVVKSHHLLLDLQQEAIRLKSRAGHGQAPRCPKYGEAANGEFQGLEARDSPDDNPWCEVVDIDRRGMWFSRKEKLGAWRAKNGSDINIWLDDGNNKIVIRNGESGKVQIFCSGPVEVLGEKVAIQAEDICTIKAPGGINFQVGGARFAFTDSAFDTNVDVRGRNIYGHFPQIRQGNGRPPGSPSGSGKSVSNLNAESVPKIEPDNRVQ